MSQASITNPKTATRKAEKYNVFTKSEQFILSIQNFIIVTKRRMHNT
jgi:hypothetical protein